MIAGIVRDRLCTQCGFCAALCPVGALVMERDRWANVFPAVNEAACTGCGLCLDICSGGGVAFPAGEESAEACAGGYEAVWSGHAADPGVRRSGSSGGVTTALLAAALDRGVAREVLAVRAEEGRPFRAEARMVSAAGEVKAASGSWYLPLSMEGAVRRVREGDGPFAVVGLPCHLHAWRKAGDRVPGLSGKVALYVGLFCDHLVDARSHRLLLSLFGVNPDEVRRVGFRGEGWPGTLRATLGGERKAVIPYGHPMRKLLWKTYLFTPRRCLFCFDALAEFADISVGDAWLPEFAADDQGTSLVAARTPRGEAYCRVLAREGALVLQPLAEERLDAAQRLQVLMKKREIGARIRIAQLLGWKVPGYGVKMPPPTVGGYLMGAAALASSVLSGKLPSERPARLVPWRLAAAVYARLRGEGAGR